MKDYRIVGIPYDEMPEKIDELLDEVENLQQRIDKAIEKLSFIDEAIENDLLTTMLCITKINSALEILGGKE